ncbi:hypothetical protein FOL47_001172, partial [Perkinsus chesapeaki]
AILKEHPSEESAVLLIDEELESNTSSKGPLSFEFIKRLMTIIDKVPHGVIEREEGSDEPRTSCNLGVLRIVSKDGSEFAMVHVFPRSTSMEALRVVGQQFSELGDKVGAKSETDICPFPGWEPDRESELLKVVRSTCPTVADPRIYTVHGGLECGTLMVRLPSVKECVSIGPTAKVLAFAVAPSATWRAILAGLELLEHLLNKASIELWRECTRGEHFDATQRLLFLGSYTSPDDPRVTKLVRERAKRLRSALMAKDDMINSLRVGETSDETERDVHRRNKTEESSSSGELTSDEEGPKFPLEYDASDGIKVQRKPAESKPFTYGDKALREGYQSNIISGFAVIGHNPDTSSSEDEGLTGGSRIALCATGGTPHTNRQTIQRKRSRRHHSAGDLGMTKEVVRGGKEAANRSNSSPIVDLL